MYPWSGSPRVAGGPGGLCSWRASRWLRGSRAPTLRRHELLGRPSGLPLPIRMFPEATQRRHRLGALRASARTEPAGRLTERLLPGSLLDLIKKKKKNSLRHLVATFTARPQGSLEARWSWRAGEGRWPSCTADTLHKRRRPVRRVWDDGSVPGGPSLLHEPFP